MTTGNRLRQARQTAGFETVRAFLKAHNVTDTEYRPFEEDKKQLSYSIANKYSALLGNCSANWLLDGKGTSPDGKESDKVRAELSAKTVNKSGRPAGGSEAVDSLKRPSDRLKYAREAAGFETIRAFVKAKGIMDTLYRPYEEGKKTLSFTAANQYAMSLANCSASWLLDGKGTGPDGDEGEIARAALSAMTVNRDDNESKTAVNKPSDRLKYAREAAGFETIRAFVKAKGMMDTLYRPYEEGKKTLSFTAANQYAASLANCSASWLLDGKGWGPDGDEREIARAELAAMTVNRAEDVSTEPSRTPSDRLKYARESAGYATIGDFVKAHGVFETLYRPLEEGKKAIPFAKANEYAAFLGNCSSTWILDGTGMGPDGDESEKVRDELVALTVNRAEEGPVDELALAMSERLKLAREAAGFVSSSDFARAHKMLETSYLPYEEGELVFSFAVANEYAALLGNCSSNWLMTGGNGGVDGEDDAFKVPASSGERLNLAREAAGYDTSSAFAKAKDFKETVYRAYESGDQALTFAKANEYAALLGNCATTWLFIGKGRGPADGAALANVPASSGERLILARGAAGYQAPSDFARAKEFRPETYLPFESGEQALNFAKANEFAALLGNCSSSWLFLGRGRGPADGSSLGNIPASSGDRLILARDDAGYATPADFVSAKKLAEVIYRTHEDGSRALTFANANEYAGMLGNCSSSWLFIGVGFGPVVADKVKKVPAVTGERLKLARVSAGFETTIAFAIAKNIQEQAYSEFETGQRDLNKELATLYAAVLGNCTADWLLTGEGDSPG